ncbi:FG-GAP repeat domain-containing protein [Cystobacter fuscus]|uniref:FG-GAP repeat domain-containing protein n=1 Tax=Cystobacter fuscus TaxID=43 RepID=UPI002B2C3F97|nr:VCBS repeat-containing protein [Cystobacter fuscus]
MSSTRNSAFSSLLLVPLLGALCLLPVACEEPPRRPPPIGDNPGTGNPGNPDNPGPGGDADGGLVLASDGGTFEAKPSCTGGSTSCQGACPDGGAVCLGNCGFLPPVRYVLGGDQVELAVGDLQNDGSEDLVTADTSGRAIAVLLNRRQGLFQTPSLWRAEQPTSMVLARLDGNSSLDVLTTNSGNSTLGLYRGLGNGSFERLLSSPSAPLLRDLTVWEENGSRRVAAINAGTQEVSVFPVNGDGSLGTATSYRAPPEPRALVVTDFNGDGRPDLAVAHAAACASTQDTACESVGLLLGQSDGTFAAQRITQTGGTPIGLVAARLDGDALPDLIVADSRRNQVIVLIARGDGSFFAQASYPTVRSPSRLLLMDVNRDTVPDLVVGSLGNEVGVLLGQPGGSFAAQVALPATNLEAGIRALASADFDKDGFNDLAVLTGSGVQLLWGICR